MTNIKQDYNDILFLISSDTSPLLNTFTKFMQQICQRENIKWTKDNEITIRNKYFSSDIESQQLEINELADDAGIENYIMFIESIDQYYDLISKTKFRQFFSNEEIKFKLLIVRASMTGKFKEEELYKAIETYIPIFSLEIDENYDSVNNNIEIIEEVIEMLANNLWKSKTDETVQTKKKEEPIKQDPVNFEEKEKQFLNAFDQILSFSQIKNTLSPKSRKQQACDLMEKMLKQIDFDDEEDEEGYTNLE